MITRTYPLRRRRAVRHTAPPAQTGAEPAGRPATKRKRGRRGGRRTGKAATEARRLDRILGEINNEYDARRVDWADKSRPTLSIEVAKGIADEFDEEIAGLYAEKAQAEREAER
jgi:hypothetical protein